MSSFLETSMEIAREAGALLSQYFEKRVTYQLKGEFDLVTEADRASERLVVDRLRSHFPTHSVLGEEGGVREGSSEYRWYVDPLDGTTNFYHGFPMFNVTLALERAGELVAGCIYDPLRDEMFAAERSAGAWLNGNRMQVSKIGRLEECLVATGFPSRKRHLNVNVHFFYQMSMWTHGARRAGSAALDLAYTACGRLDVYWEFGLKPWDMAAGVLLVSEAGGQVSGMHGEPVQVGGPHVLADNGLVHGQVLELFDEVFGGRYRTPLPSVEAEP
jgi:myo-inositol-1(or 4)-monophosphatase